MVGRTDRCRASGQPRLGQQVKRNVSEIRSKKRPKLAILGTGPSLDRYDLSYELLGKDVFALNGAICAIWPLPISAWWIPTMASLKASRRRRRNPYRHAVNSLGDPRAIIQTGETVPKEFETREYLATDIEPISKLGLTSLDVALDLAIRWGYRDITMYGVDLSTEAIPKRELLNIAVKTRDRTRYHAESLSFLARPPNKLRHLKDGLLKYAHRLTPYVKIGKHSLWTDSPFEVSG